MSHPNLELPYIAIVPYAVNSSALTSSEKLYFGSLAALAKKEGYCWATDEELSQMHKKSPSTIKRWNRALEKKGFIKKVTANITYRDEKNRVLWKPKRKIYVNDGFSKNVCDRVINDPLNERVINEPCNNNKPLKEKPPTLPSSKSRKPKIKRDPPKPKASVHPVGRLVFSQETEQRLKKLEERGPSKKLREKMIAVGENVWEPILCHVEAEYERGKVESPLGLFLSYLQNEWSPPRSATPPKKYDPPPEKVMFFLAKMPLWGLETNVKYGKILLKDHKETVEYQGLTTQEVVKKLNILVQKYGKKLR